MVKLDYKKKLKTFYGASSKKVEFVRVPPMNYLMVDGTGGPAHQDFSLAVEALFSLAYVIKFTIKKRDQIDFGVMPLEAQWWSEDMNSFITGDKTQWNWTVMIMQPSLVTKMLVGAIMLFAFYVQFHGDFSPGGGFQAGVIMAVAFILYGIVFGLKRFFYS